MLRLVEEERGPRGDNDEEQQQPLYYYYYRRPATNNNKDAAVVGGGSTDDVWSGVCGGLLCLLFLAILLMAMSFPSAYYYEQYSNQNDWPARMSRRPSPWSYTP